MKHGFLYAAKLIPASWFRESQKDITGLMNKTKKKEK